MLIALRHVYVLTVSCDCLQVFIFQYSFWFSLFLLFFTAAYRVSLFGIFYLLVGFVFLFRGQQMLRDRRRIRHMWYVYTYNVHILTPLNFYKLTQKRWLCMSAFPSTVINPRRMREGYSSRSVCVCVCVCLSVCLSVCYHANCYIPRLRVQIAML